MRNALTALISAASFCAVATAASAQMLYYPDNGAAPTVPSATGAPLYGYRHNTGPRPGVVGSCEIISGNRICFSGPMGSDAGYAAGGPMGAVVGAPFAIIAAPFTAVGAMGQPIVATGSYAPAAGETYAPATGTPAYSYQSQVGAHPAWNGHCDVISGNRVCTTP